MKAPDDSLQPCSTQDLLHHALQPFLHIGRDIGNHVLFCNSLLLVLGASFFMAPKYRSETVIIVEPQTFEEHYVVPSISADVQERLQNMMQQILSRTTL